MSSSLDSSSSSSNLPDECILPRSPSVAACSPRAFEVDLVKNGSPLSESVCRHTVVSSQMTICGYRDVNFRGRESVAGQTRRILKSQIELREGSEISAMPGGFGDILSPTHVADLLAYLRIQTSAPSTAEELGASTDTQKDTINVQEDSSASSTSGMTHSEQMEPSATNKN